MFMLETSKKHLKDVNKSYKEHFKIAFFYGFLLLHGAFASFIHGLIPGMYMKTPTQTALLFKEVINKINKSREERGINPLELEDNFKKLL